MWLLLLCRDVRHVAAHEGNDEEIRCRQNQEADIGVPNVGYIQKPDQRFVRDKEHDGVPADVGDVRQMLDDFAQKQKCQYARDGEQGLLDVKKDVGGGIEEAQRYEQEERQGQGFPDRQSAYDVVSRSHIAKVEVEDVNEGFTDRCRQRQDFPQHDSQHETAESQEDVRLDEAVQHIEGDVQHE